MGGHNADEHLQRKIDELAGDAFMQRQQEAYLKAAREAILNKVWVKQPGGGAKLILRTGEDM